MCRAQIFSVLVCQNKVGVELKICFCQRLGHTHNVCNVCSTLLQSCTTHLASVWRWKCSKGARWWWWCGFLFWNICQCSETGPICESSSVTAGWPLRELSINNSRGQGKLAKLEIVRWDQNWPANLREFEISSQQQSTILWIEFNFLAKSNFVSLVINCHKVTGWTKGRGTQRKTLLTQ